jgi:hypothetical protein
MTDQKALGLLDRAGWSLGLPPPPWPSDAKTLGLWWQALKRAALERLVPPTSPRPHRGNCLLCREGPLGGFYVPTGLKHHWGTTCPTGHAARYLLKRCAEVEGAEVEP